MPNHDKHATMMVYSSQPFNAAPPPDRLCQSYITPSTLFFARSHGTIPNIDPTHFRLVVAGRVDCRLSLSLDDLRANFARREVVATLQCAGNRRKDLLAHGPIPDELLWDADAIGTATWAGAGLADVLTAAGIQPGAHHVAFEGLDEVEKHGQRFPLGGSIPTAKALGGEVVLAYEMNGQPLAPVHGFPLRALVPGYIGARSVKWLGRITLQAEPSDNYFQRRAYKLFGPQVTPENVDWNTGIMLGPLVVNAVICYPQPGAVVKSDIIHIGGYALAGEAEQVERVEWSLDGGTSWQPAHLLDGGSEWAWRRWSCELSLAPGENEISVRAWDSAGNTQPASTADVWNFKGYMNNVWHRIRVVRR